MKKVLWGTTAAGLLLAAAFSLTALAHPQEDSFIPGTNVAFLKHGVDRDLAPATTPSAAASAQTLTYFGGPVLANVKVVKVLYGSGTYPSYVSGTGSGTISAFFKGVVGSSYFSWLNNDYHTSTSTVGLGTYGGDYSITPASARDGRVIPDIGIQQEINAQISAGHLPAPNANTAYMVYFPKGKRITQGGAQSCVAGGFCAYHGTFKRNGTNVYYGVLPDNSSGSGCDVGCGGSTPYNNWTSVSSHELVETVTDPAVGLATVVGPPLAWYNATYGEIGDICNAQQGSVTGTDGITYTVQKEWSNSKSACILHF